MKRKKHHIFIPAVGRLYVAAMCFCPTCLFAGRMYRAALDNNVRMKNAQNKPPHGGTQQTRGFQ